MYLMHIKFHNNGPEVEGIKIFETWGCAAGVLDLRVHKSMFKSLKRAIVLGNSFTENTSQRLWLIMIAKDCSWIGWSRLITFSLSQC